MSRPAASVEVVNRSIAALPDQVVRAPVAVDGVPSGPVDEVVRTQAAVDEVGTTAAVELVVATKAGEMLRLPCARDDVDPVGVCDRDLVSRQGHAGRGHHHEGHDRKYRRRPPHLRVPFLVGPLGRQWVLIVKKVGNGTATDK
jgi:hypothetical protein